MNSNENYIEELNKKLEIYFEKKEYKKALEEIQIGRASCRERV